MSQRARLLALVVNYNTGSYALACVRSLLREWERAGRERGLLEVVCVDNASPIDQEAFLVELESLGVRVLRSEENLGYARGMNAALDCVPPAQESGIPEVVGILNPDLLFLPDSVETLVNFVLENPDVGCVDPATCIDALGVFSLPRNLLPTPAEHWRVNLAQMSPSMCRRYSRMRARLGLEWWTRKGAFDSNMLSGCCVFLRREVVERMGHVMDPRYPLYFEDTDLFRTVAALGYRVMHHNAARILHHWSRSALVGGEFGEPQRFLEISQAAYFKKFYGPIGRLSVRLAAALLKRWPASKRGRPMAEMTDLGNLEKPLELQWEHSCRFVVEFAVNPTFIICAGAFGEGNSWSCPPEAWDWLFQLDYHVRILNRDTLEPLGYWRFVKITPGRDHAMSLEELDELGPRLLSGVCK